jgi:hypothetical protein
MKGNATALGPLEDFLGRCDGVKKEANGDYKALWPVHDDHDPSLEIGWHEDGEKGTVRFVCRSRRCDKNAILAALGLEWKDLYRQRGTGGAHPARERVFEIRDAGGRLYGKHHRRGDGEDKAVWWTFHKGSRLKVDELPFHRSERGWGDGDVVLIVEGEATTEAADRAP